MITAESWWRNLGNVTPERWRQQLVAAGSPIAAEWEATYAAAKPHTALCLAMLEVESRYATRFNANVPENKNPLNLRPPSGGGYMAFDSYTEAVRAWRDRITDPAYKGGVYDKTVTILELIERYAPANDSNDPSAYAAIVAARVTSWQQEETPVSDTLVFGRVPYPVVTERHLPLGGWVKAGAPAAPEAVVWHRMIGSLWGTDGWFFGGNAATAYGIGVTSIDGADDAGRIIEWMDPASGHYGESSGPAKAPYGDGALFVQRFGVSNVNRLTKAIEISGNYDTPLDEPARRSIVALTAYWADQKRIPWHQFPIVPGTQRSFVIWHQEITGPAYKACPGWQVMNETSALIARVRDVLKAAQTITEQPKPPVYEPSQLPEWWEQSIVQSWPSDADHDGVRYRVARRNVEALKTAVRRSKPDAHAPKSGPNFLVREKANVERVLTIPTVNAKGKTVNVHWILTADGHYVAASSFSPQIIVKPR